MSSSFITNMSYLTNRINKNVYIVKVRSGKKTTMDTNPEEEFNFCEGFEFPYPYVRERF